jgi:hypothetical protein
MFPEKQNSARSASKGWLSPLAVQRMAVPVGQGWLSPLANPLAAVGPVTVGPVGPLLAPVQQCGLNGRKDVIFELRVKPVTNKPRSFSL